MNTKHIGSSALLYVLCLNYCNEISPSFIIQLHTLEDFPAHSNFCELVLLSMGHSQVFVHVGDQVRVQAPNGRWVAPIVTGTFGSSDFIHSLLGGLWYLT